MLFINHSCEPNVGFAGNTVLVAMRDISPGEELTTDYALFDDYDGMMQCRCGTPSCRATIGGQDWQRRDMLNEAVITIECEAHEPSVAAETVRSIIRRNAELVAHIGVREIEIIIISPVS
jgi:hypothetical protein